MLQAQERLILVGKITSFQTGEALSGANLLAENTPFGTSADSEGFYRLVIYLSQVPFDPITVSVLHIGYQTTRITIPAMGGKTIRDFALTMDAIKLDEVIVSGERSKVEIGEYRAFSSNIIGRDQLDRLNAERWIEVLPISYRYKLEEGKMLLVVDNLPFKTDMAMVNQFQFAGSTVPNSEPMFNLSPDEILLIEIVRGSELVYRFGRAAQNGVVIITTRQSKENKRPMFEGKIRWPWSKKN